MIEHATPNDIAEIHERFNATCGPIALAAFFGVNVADVMRYFKAPFPGWCSGRDMEAALRLTQRSFTSKYEAWPSHGLCWISLTGPWCARHLPYGAQLAHSHWVAVKGHAIYDPMVERWLENANWQREVIRPWIDRTKRADGWKVLRGLEVRHA